MIDQYKPNYNHQDKFMRTPLHHAARASNETAISFLLHMGMQPQEEMQINVDCQTIGQETPLMKAAEAGNRNIVVALLRASCNPFLENVMGKTADMYAESNHPSMDIHSVLREYMEEIRSGALDDPTDSVTMRPPN